MPLTLAVVDVTSHQTDPVVVQRVVTVTINTCIRLLNAPLRIILISHTGMFKSNSDRFDTVDAQMLCFVISFISLISEFVKFEQEQ